MAISLASLRMTSALTPPRILIHGVAGVGKSTFASDADRPVFIMTEDGLGKLQVPHFPLATSYAEMAGALDALLTEDHDFGTVVIDSVDWLEPLIWADLDARGLKRPEFVIVDGAPGLEAALVALWGDDLPIQRCTVHKHRNLLAHAPKQMHDELAEDYRDMIYADSAVEIEKRRKAFLRKWRLKCRAVAESLEEAGDRLFTFTRLDPSQWKSARTTNAIERLNEEFRRRIKTQTVLPCAETVPMLLWALLASGQIQMRKVDGWETLSQPIEPMPLDLAA